MRKKIELATIGDIIFYIDRGNADVIYDFLQEKGKAKLRKKLQKIASSIATKDEYSKEEYTRKIKNVTAIKFKGKQFNNARIYCRDYVDNNNQRVIVLAELLASKKQNKLTRKEKTLINKVNNYDYEI